MKKKYEFKEIEKKWQNIWEDSDSFAAPEDIDKKKYYVLEMFPYPSGKLHMGHVRNYSIGDVVARTKIMKGYNVLHPIGYDAFGLPAENAAIKNGAEPSKWTHENMEEMTKQLKELGLSYDWKRRIATCDPEYYKWMQWIFIEFFNKGIAYKKENPVNFCPDCQTVLANEQVVDGCCERCDSKVGKKSLSQWYFKITDYADRLLEGLEDLPGWPYKVKLMQKNWIGKSKGAGVNFDIEGREEKLEIYTTRPDTLYGVTYMVLAPEHPYVDALTRGTEFEKPVREYIEKVSHMSDIERTSTVSKKTGVFIGKYGVNPLNGKRLPIFISDYVLMGYGTGAIMAVPAHDQRDFDFAKKFDLEIIPVVDPENESIDVNDLKEAFVAEGKLINSGKFNGMDSNLALTEIIEYIKEKKLGREAINYRLRDWLISRQRYWGTPIPMIYCDCCGWVPEKKENLPVILPKDVEFTGKGESPLAGSTAFAETVCPECGKKARRETDTMDTFLDSSWYFLRYCDPKNKEEAWNKEQADYWMNVDQYIGGVEHAILHLMYARFFQKALYDLGYTSYSEPFENLLTQGMVLKDGFKMSKSKGNVVSPAEIIEKYGADTARLFILFAAPPERELEWSDRGVEGSFRFIKRVYSLVSEALEKYEIPADRFDIKNKDDRELNFVLNSTIKKVTEDIEKRFNFNTAISSIMELVNDMYKYKEKEEVNPGLYFHAIRMMILLLSPFIPHLSEELWENLGNSETVLRSPWPEADPKAMIREEVTIVVQLNGKLKDKMELSKDLSKEELEKAVLNNPKIVQNLEGKTVKKVIVIPGKLVNIVI